MYTCTSPDDETLKKRARYSCFLRETTINTRRDINGFVRWFYSLGSNCYSRERWCYDRTFFFNAAFQGKRDESYSWSSVLQGRDGIQVERETWRLERVFGQSWPKCVTRDYVDRRLRIQKYILLVRGEIGYRDSWSEWQLNYTLLERRTSLRC